MADATIIDTVQELSDLELAVLICLVAQEHCIIDTEPDALEDLSQELQLVASKVFGLPYAVIDCSKHTSLDEFADAILSVEDDQEKSTTPRRLRQDGYFLSNPAFTTISRSPPAEGFGDNRTIANVIIAKNLDEAPKQVQIQALELMRTKRIYTRTSVQNTPKRFLFIAMLGGGDGPRLTKHLNDYMFISHFHDPEDGYPNFEEACEDGNSISSIIKKTSAPEPLGNAGPRISENDIKHLTKLSESSTVSVEIKQYQHNIISFLRMHRAVAGGVSAEATKHFDKLARCLAPLHHLSFVTPSITALAARKIYLHRIQIVRPEQERSMQWGSDIAAVAAALDGVGAIEVIEEVLSPSGAEAPL